MNDVKYSTKEEKRLICSTQESIGALANGYIGTDSMILINHKLGGGGFPYTVKMYGVPVIVGVDIRLFSPKAPLSRFANSMLGSFTYPRAVNPCSILINGGKVLCGASCHAHMGKPESVIYKTAKGVVGLKRVLSAEDLPAGVVTAVGGMGLCPDYDPAAEGFSGQYADVLRRTNHNVIGYKRGLWYGIYFANKTGAEMRNIVRNKFCFEYALLLDGGGLAAINGAESFAKIGTNISQGYAIQFI